MAHSNWISANDSDLEFHSPPSSRKSSLQAVHQESGRWFPGSLAHQNPTGFLRMKTLDDVLTNESFLLASVGLTINFSLVIMTHLGFRITLNYAAPSGERLYE